MVEADSLAEAAKQLNAEIRQLHSGWARIILPDGSHAILRITVEEPYNLFLVLTRYHEGTLAHDETLEMFQYLVDVDLLPQVSPDIRAVAHDLILSGEIKPKAKEV